MIYLINGKNHKFTGENKIYIGRANQFYNLPESPLANPFVIGKDGDRKQVLELYRQWLWQQIQFDSPARRELLEILRRDRENDVVLTCWCSPLPCHGDVIIKCLNWMLLEEVKQ